MKKMSEQKLLLTALSIILLAGNAVGVIEGFPDKIIVGEKPTGVSFTIYNPENVPRNVSVEFFIPTSFVFLEKPGRLEANEAKKAVIKIFPSNEVRGKNFTGKLVAEMGILRIEKNFDIFYSSPAKESCPAEITTTISTEKNGQEYNVLSEVKNTTGNGINFKLVSVRGLPSDWEIDTQNISYINPLETGKINSKITPKSSFSGEISLVFSCENFVEVRKHQITHEQKDLLAGAGLAGLFSPDNKALSLFGENALNILLVIVASVLMVMFISRLVKLSVEKNAYDTRLAGQIERQNKQHEKKHATESRHLNELKSLVANKGAKK